MKKHLLIAGLVLTIATSVISGTMAAYNTSVDAFNGDELVAKHFVLDAGRTETAPLNQQKIAPGETVEMSFSVSNGKDGTVTEVPMNVVINITADHKNDNNANKLEYTLYKDSVVSTNVVGSTKNGTLVYDKLFFDYKETAQTQDFILVAHWPTGTYNNGDTDLQGESFGVTTSITVSGFQADSDGNLVATAP